MSTRRWVSPPLDDDIPIRNGLRSKLLYFWRNTFEDLYVTLQAAEGIEAYLGMAAADYMHPAGGVTVSFHRELSFNFQLGVTEILDDYWASYLCLLNGFTKQSHQILRNTLEMVIQICYLAHLETTTGSSVDDWAGGSRGIGKVPDKLRAIKSWLDFKEHGTAVRLERMYNLLCASTHSHKGRMAALRMPRLGAAGDMPTIEPTEVVFSQALFFAVLNAEIPLLARVLDMWAVDPWKSTLASIFAEMGAMVHRYRRVIDAFHKGYLIHREHVALSDGTQIVYSIRLDGSSVVPGRKRLLTRAQATELREFVQQRLLQDKR